MLRGTPQEPESQSEKSQTRARKATSIGNSAFTASLTADTAGHHPTDDEADDSIPDDVACEQFASFTRENPKASLQPVLGARRATAPMRRRQIGMLMIPATDKIEEKASF
jgi:hypothetical protein